MQLVMRQWAVQLSDWGLQEWVQLELWCGRSSWLAGGFAGGDRSEGSSWLAGGFVGGGRRCKAVTFSIRISTRLEGGQFDQG